MRQIAEKLREILNDCSDFEQGPEKFFLSIKDYYALMEEIPPELRVSPTGATFRGVELVKVDFNIESLAAVSKSFDRCPVGSYVNAEVTIDPQATEFRAPDYNNFDMHGRFSTRTFERHKFVNRQGELFWLWKRTE